MTLPKDAAAIDRRRLMAAVAAAAALPGTGRAQTASDAPLRALEQSVQGWLGVMALRSDGRILLSHRANDRFPMDSTFKASLAAAVLARVDRGQERLDRRLPVTRADILANSPVTETLVAAGEADLATLCQAAITVSDNAAANLLLGTVGGPAGLTAFWRRLGDRVTRLDRIEPGLNEGTPGDPRDTTSPAAMAGVLRNLIFGRALSAESRQRLTGWMGQTRTGLNLLRAGVPADWRAADKTGRGGHGSVNDIAVFWPPGGLPVIVTCYLTATEAATPLKEQTHAEVGRLVAAAWRAQR